MRYIIKEYDKHVEITGYRNVAFAKIEMFLKANRKLTSQNVDIQFFDAELVATQEHLYFAVLNALQAFRTQTNISKSVAVETMLYASAKRQIQKAIDIIGVNPESETVAAVIVGATPEQVEDALQELTVQLGVKPDDSVLKLSAQKEKKIRGAFKIGDREVETVKETTDEAALVDLVIEHVALLSTQQ